MWKSNAETTSRTTTRPAIRAAAYILGGMGMPPYAMSLRAKRSNLTRNRTRREIAASACLLAMTDSQAGNPLPE
jgi:hypothetical protein